MDDKVRTGWTNRVVLCKVLLGSDKRSMGLFIVYCPLSLEVYTMNYGFVRVVLVRVIFSPGIYLPSNSTDYDTKNKLSCIIWTNQYNNFTSSVIILGLDKRSNDETICSLSLSLYKRILTRIHSIYFVSVSRMFVITLSYFKEKINIASNQRRVLRTVFLHRTRSK